MPVPQSVLTWAKKFCPSPQVDPVWLNDCYEYVVNKYKLDPSTGINEIIDQIKNQLLGSDLIDSTVPGTGIQRDLNAEVVSEIKGPVMVELLEMMEVGIPAFDLMQVRQARLDHERYQHDEEEITPMPQYPRKVVDCTLSDGSQVFVGIEYVKPFPELDLVQTRLGLKMMLTNVEVRRGRALLDRGNTQFLGGVSEVREANKDKIFLATLRRNMGLPPEDALDQAPPSPRQLPQSPPPPPPVQIRSPLREISPAGDIPGGSMIHGEDADLPRRRKVPRRVVDPASPPPAVTKLAVTTKTSPPVNRRPAPRYQPPPPGPVSPERDANSRYFSSSSSSKKRPPSSSGMAGSSRGSGIRKELKRQNTLPDLTWDLRAACQPDEMAVVEEMYVEAEPEETQIEHQSGSGKSGRDITKTKRSPVFKGNQAPSGTSKGKEKATDLSAGSESDRVVLRDASGEEMMKNLTKRITNNQSKGKQKLADGDSDITRMDVDTHITVDPDEVLNQTDSEYGFDMEYSQSFLLSVDKTAQEALAKSRPIPDSPPPPSQPRRSPRRHPLSKPQSRKQQPFPRTEDSDVEFGDTLVGSSSVTPGTRGFTTQTTLIPSSPTLISPTSRRVDNKFGRRPSISRPGPGRNSAYFKGKSSTSQAHPPGSMAAPIDVDRDVMEILDSEEEEKENKAVPTRRVRRRISSDTSIIELSSEL